uniref:Uncharacterized protein n=1 Tax=Anguilla anguilla TaxID=7936 RepID=A0A0E9WWJ0_ANGAN
MQVYKILFITYSSLTYSYSNLFLCNNIMVLNVMFLDRSGYLLKFVNGFLSIFVTA